MNITKIIVLLAAAVIPLGAQQETPSVQSKATNACADAQSTGFATGWQMALLAYAPSFGDSPDKLKIGILVENIDGQDSFRFAAAEVIRTQFSERLQIEPQSNLTLYVGGTNPTAQTQAQAITFGVKAYITHFAAAGGQQRALRGSFEIATDAMVLQRYTEERRVQLVKEEVYAVLSNFLKQWDEAKSN